MVNTLNPKRLTSKDYLDLSGKWSDTIFVTARDQRHPDQLTKAVGLESTGTARMQYPPKTGGFLYLQRPPSGAPATAAELRFRITNSPDPRSFTQGVDRMFFGLPWKRQVVWMYMRFLLSVLARDKTFSPAVLQRISVMHEFLRRSEAPLATFNRGRSMNLLYSRSQPFLLTAASPRERFWLLTEKDGKDSLDFFIYEMPCIQKNDEEWTVDIERMKERGKTASSLRSAYSGRSTGTKSSDDAHRLLQVLR